jgi:hypothetical protein
MNVQSKALVFDRPFRGIQERSRCDVDFRNELEPPQDKPVTSKEGTGRWRKR